MPTFVIKWVAPVLIVLAVIGGIYAKGRIDSKHAAEVASIKHELSLQKQQVEVERSARIADAAFAKEQSEKISELKSTAESIQEYADALEDARRECLSSADSDRLRDLWK